MDQSKKTTTEESKKTEPNKKTKTETEKGKTKQKTASKGKTVKKDSKKTKEEATKKPAAKTTKAASDKTKKSEKTDKPVKTKAKTGTAAKKSAATAKKTAAGKTDKKDKAADAKKKSAAAAKKSAAGKADKKDKAADTKKKSAATAKKSAAGKTDKKDKTADTKKKSAAAAKKTAAGKTDKKDKAADAKKKSAATAKKSAVGKTDKKDKTADTRKKPAVASKKTTTGKGKSDNKDKQADTNVKTVKTAEKPGKEDKLAETKQKSPAAAKKTATGKGKSDNKGKKAESKTKTAKTAKKTTSEKTAREVKKDKPAEPGPRTSKKPEKPVTGKDEKSNKVDSTLDVEINENNKNAQLPTEKTEKKSGDTVEKRGNKQQGKKAAHKSDSKKNSSPSKKNLQYKLFINAEEPEEARIALLENGKLESLHIETIVSVQTKGNIYKGKIVSVEPSLQAAFVDIGEHKNGFLPFGDIHPEYYNQDVDPDTHWKDLKIQEVISIGQPVLVEVVKEPTGNKGANITTFLSLPGRFLVLMPGSDSAGISRKIEDRERARLKEIFSSFKMPEGIGYIIRTASININKTTLSQDHKYLLRLWEEIKSKGQVMPAPSLIYKEQDVVARFLRDHFNNEIKEIIVDNQESMEQVNRFLTLQPSKQHKAIARIHKGSKPIFHQHQIEEQIEHIFKPLVKLPSGGSIVINPTEALVAIDVNSGRTDKDKNFEESIFLANMEAAEELARQLRLRDLGGLIVVDFIDMRDKKHIRDVERKVSNSLKRDKAKTDLGRISKFGLLQISRQRLGPPIQTGSYKQCEHCKGHGIIRSVEMQSLAYLRRIQTGITRKNIDKVKCCLPLKIAQYLLNQKRNDIHTLEKKYRAEIFIEADPAMSPTDQKIEFVKSQRNNK
jgi:ribonuclease E